MGGGYSVTHAAALAAQLPHSSRICTAASPDNCWSLEARLLSAIDYRLQLIDYRLRGGKGDKPKPLFSPTSRAEKGEGMDVEELKEFLGRSREEWQQS